MAILEIVSAKHRREEYANLPENVEILRQWEAPDFRALLGDPDEQHGIKPHSLLRVGVDALAAQSQLRQGLFLAASIKLRPRRPIGY
jgi:hypothetical protein